MRVQVNCRINYVYIVYLIEFMEKVTGFLFDYVISFVENFRLFTEFLYENRMTIITFNIEFDMNYSFDTANIIIQCGV